MKNLLVLLGKRVHDLRTANKWSQEEFAHISGLHRTYIGQIERGEKNISFANLLKISGVFGVTMSELLAGLEDNTWPEKERLGSPSERKNALSRSSFDIHRLVKRLRLQQAAIDHTLELLEESTIASGRAISPRAPTSGKDRTRKK